MAKFSLDNFLLNPISSQFWALGMLATDGCISDRYTVTVSQSGPLGLARLEVLAQILDQRPIYHYPQTRRQDVYVVSFCSKKFCEWLVPFGICPRKTRTLTFPADLVSTPEQHTAFLAECVDGDGHCSLTNKLRKNGNYSQVLKIGVSGHKPFLEGLAFLCPATPMLIETHKGSGTWALRWESAKARAIGSYILTHTGLWLKKEAYLKDCLMKENATLELP